MARTRKLFLERTHSQTVAVLLEVAPAPRRAYRLLAVFAVNDPIGIRAFMASQGEPADPVDIQNVTRRFA
jgi:hypothetical protein